MAPSSSVAPAAFPLHCGPDPEVTRTVRDVLAMLQTYGPLTAEQLEFNLPPINPAGGSDGNPNRATAGTKAARAGSSTQGVSQAHGPKKGTSAAAAGAPVGQWGAIPVAASALAAAGRRSKLQQILEVMVAAGAITVVDDGPLPSSGESSAAVKSEAGAPRTTAAAASGAVSAPPRTSGGATPVHASASAAAAPPPFRRRRYAFLHGKPRADAIMPANLLAQIRDANEEIRHARERIAFLREELRVISSDEEEDGGGAGVGAGEGAASGGDGEADGATVDAVTSGAAETGMAAAPHKDRRGRKKRKEVARRKEGGGGQQRPNMSSQQLTESARSVLHAILVRYPEVVYDPVYAAALRNVGVDSAAADRERERMLLAAAMEGAGAGAEGGGLPWRGGLVPGMGGTPFAPVSAASLLAGSGLSAGTLAAAAALAPGVGGGGVGGGSKRKSTGGTGAGGTASAAGKSSSALASSSSSSSGKKRKKDGGGGGGTDAKKKKAKQAQAKEAGRPQVVQGLSRQGAAAAQVQTILAEDASSLCSR